MNIEEIRKNAPEGCTHYFFENDITKYCISFYFGFGFDKVFNEGSWIDAILDYEKLIPIQEN